MVQGLHCGKAELTGKPQRRMLVSTDFIQPAGQFPYSMAADMLHETIAEPGTVSIVRRTFLPDQENVWVAWPEGERWGSVQARPATKAEVEAITGEALRRW
jgi:hypothetical protein